MLSMILRRLLAHPLTRGVDIDDPTTTQLRRRIIQEKPFLRAIYEDWYAQLTAALPTGTVLELGSGAGFLPNAITSDVFLVEGIDAVMDARSLPFRASSLAATVMVDVLHHVPDVGAFFGEAVRVLRPGGRIVMIEPWVTPWSRFVYRHLHHEPFLPEAATWEFPSVGPLSGANGALPWIVFVRDRARFEREFPSLRIVSIKPMMPFIYLLSGGVSMRSFVPALTFRAFRAMERALAPLMPRLAMFAAITVERRDENRFDE